MCAGANTGVTKRLLGLKGILEILDSHPGYIDAENDLLKITCLKITQLVSSKVHNRALMLDTLGTFGQGANT